MLVDGTSLHLLRELVENGRTSYSELGRRVGLSAPAVTERIRRLEEAGVIEGYHAEIALARVGRPVTAFIWLRVPAKNRDLFSAWVRRCTDILECHVVTGTDSHVLKVAVASQDALDLLVERLHGFGELTTEVIPSTR